MATNATVADNRAMGLRTSREARGLALVLAAALFAALGWNAPALPWRQRALLWAVGLVFVGNALAYFTALQHTPAAVVSLLLYTYPLMVTLMAPLFGLERLRARGLLAATLAFAGCALTAVGAGLSGVRLRGIALALLSALIYALYVVVSSRFASGIPSEAAAAHLAQACAVFFLLAGAIRGELAVPASLSAWALIAAIAVVCTVFALRAFLAGLALVGPARAAVASSVEVPITIGLAVVFLGERIGLREVLGGALILGAVALHNLRPQWRRGRPPDAV